MTEILGKFLDYMAEIRKPDGLLHTFSAGDLVEIIALPEWENGKPRYSVLVGLQATVINCYYQDALGYPAEMAVLHPNHPRPDSNDDTILLWSVDGLKLIGE